MSMISTQIDRLRDRAMRVGIFLEGSTDAIPTDTHEQLREAADTIRELSCKLVEMVDQRDEIERLKVENAKLMRIACDLHKALFTLDIDHCQACPRDNINGPCTKFAVWGNDECSIEEDMRELGIEVEP